MAKIFQLVNPTTGITRRDSDKEELRVIFEGRYRREHSEPEPTEAASYAIRSIEAIKAASPAVCVLSELTSVCFR